MFSLYNLQPLLSSRRTFFGQSVVEECFNGSFFAVVVIWIIWDKTNETTCTWSIRKLVFYERL